MASLSPEGERATLALLADLYAQNVDLGEALAAERAAHQQLQHRYDELASQIRTDAGVPDSTHP